MGRLREFPQRADIHVCDVTDSLIVTGSLRRARFCDGFINLEIYQP